MAKHVLNKARNTTWTINSDDDIWILGEKGRIAGGVPEAILSADYIDEATIRIDGTIAMTAADSYGVYLEAGRSARITVSKAAHVSADETALYYYNFAGKVNIENSGLLRGYYGIETYAGQDNITIRNDGRILSDNAGIIAYGTGADIVNSGVVKGYYGIFLDYGPNDVDTLLAENATHVVNSGKIIASDSVNSSGVAVNLRNKGLLSGHIDLSNGEDRIDNRGGTITGDIYGDGGDDVINMAGGRLNGVIYGEHGDDIVTLGSPATVYVEYSNQGIDTVRINGSYQLGAHIESLVLLGKGNHTGIGNSQANYLKGNRGDNVLYGQGGDDELDGGAGNDTLYSGGGGGYLIGGAGRDKLYGGDGWEGIDGGDGNDVLTGGAGNDGFIFEPGYGRDTITDFEQGSDQVHLYGFGDFAAIDDKIKYSGGDAVINLGGGDVIIIRNILPNSLTDMDFDFY